MRCRVSIPAMSVVCALVCVLVGCASTTRVDSHAGAPFAGLVPWNSAVVDRDGRTVHLLADWDHIDHFACGLPNERLDVDQDGSRVVVTVRGYAKPLPAGVACGGVGAPLQPFTVVLSHRLGTRPLIDGQTHNPRRVVLDASVPTAHSLPAGYAPQPMSWSFDSADEHTATRVWSTGRPNSRVFIRLTVGLPTTFSTFTGPAGSSRGTTRVDGVTASVSAVADAGQVVTTIRWTAASGQQRRLEAFGTRAARLSTSEVTAVAESVR